MLRYGCQPPPSVRYSSARARSSAPRVCASSMLLLEQVLIGRQDLDVAGEARVVARAGQVGRVLQRRHADLPLHAHLGQLLNRHQRVGHLAVAVERGLLVLGERRVEARLHRLEVPAEASGLEDGLKAARRRATTPPPSPPRNVVRSPLTPPRNPVRLIVGKNSALAAPMSALAATRSCSACTTSGRRSSSDAGRPGGIGGGKASPSARRSRAIGAGGRPSSSESAFSTMAICCLDVGNRGGGQRPVGHGCDRARAGSTRRRPDGSGNR